MTRRRTPSKSPADTALAGRTLTVKFTHSASESLIVEYAQTGIDLPRVRHRRAGRNLCGVPPRR